MRLDPLSPEPLTLMPDAPSTVPKPVGTSSDPTLDSQTSLTEAKASLQKSKAAAEADDLKERILFREVKTRALRDPIVQEQWEAFHSAATTREKTAALKRYYNRLFARMQTLEPSLKNRIEKTKAEALSRIDLKPPFDSVPAIHRQNG